MSDPIQDHALGINRRHFFGKATKGFGLGAAALSGLLGKQGFADQGIARPASPNLHGHFPNHTPKAKRVIYMFQSGAPSQQDLFDQKPLLNKHHGEDMRDHFEMTQRITGMTKNQAAFPLAGSRYEFSRHGKCGMELSELLPHIGGIADDITLIRSMHTEAINHDPAITFFQTGSQIPGRPSIGSWLSYGLGSECEDLPAFVAMVSRGTGRPNCQPLYDRLWGSGFLPTQHSGVKFMGTGDPVLYLKDPNGLGRNDRRRMLDDLAKLNHRSLEEFGDPEIDTRIQSYEMAFRMQASVPDLTDISNEPDSVLDMYGPSVRERGTYAYNCLMARRLAERDVRFIQLFHMGWDQHGSLHSQLSGQCRDADQASAALVTDLKQRGLLDDTLVVWGGEFGRTSYCQGKLSREVYGRDHHPRCFSIWMAGAGIKQGHIHGATDDFCYDITEGGVHVHDLHATMLELLGIDHERLVYKFQGRRFRLTDVHGHIVKEILA